MSNPNRDRKNQPPTGEGKKQSPRSGAAHKLSKRSEVLQAAGRRQNITSVQDEETARASGAQVEIHAARAPVDRVASAPRQRHCLPIK